MMFAVLTICVIASMLVLAVSLHGSVRAVCSDSRRKKMSPLELLSRYPRTYRRLAAVWGRYAVGTLVLGAAWSGALALVDSGESSPWRVACAVALDAIFVINVLMVAVAVRYYYRSRHYNATFDENTRELLDSVMSEEARGSDSLTSEIAKARERMDAAAKAASDEWQRELSEALNRQAR